MSGTTVTSEAVVGRRQASRGTKGVMLIVMLAGIAVCVRTLALGTETTWTPFLSESSARFLFRFLTIAMGLGAWFVSQSLIGARGCRDGASGDAVHEWTSPPHGWLLRHPRAANALLITSSVANDFFFSGHTAIAVLGAIEVAKIAPSWMAVAAAVIAGFEATTVLVLRAHYTMDVLTAVVAAFCVAGLAAILCVGF